MTGEQFLDGLFRGTLHARPYEFDSLAGARPWWPPLADVWTHDNPEVSGSHARQSWDEARALLDELHAAYAKAVRFRRSSSVRAVAPLMSRGARNIAWIEAHCRIPEGASVGAPVTLRDWQRQVLLAIYDTPTRRAIVSFSKKNGKTSLASFLLLLHTAGPEARPNAQLFSAAQSREQAGILFALAAKTVRLSSELGAVVLIRDATKQLYCSELGSLYRALSAEAATAHGVSPTFTVHDELGQVRGPRSELYEALESAAGAQHEPLSLIISTQAPTDDDLLSVLIDDAKTGADPRVKLFLFTAPMELDPFSDEAIALANPAAGDFLSLSELRSQAESARRMPAREGSFRNYTLNQRVQATATFVSKSVWDACNAAPDRDVLRYARVWIGLDLSARNDLTALIAVAEDESHCWHVFCEFFAPEIGVIERGRRDRVPYDQWAAEGLLTLTPGASVDYSFVAARLVALADECDVAGIAFDRWNIERLKRELVDLERELPLVEFGQGYKDMSPAIDSLESEILNVRLYHGSNPILTWCVSNSSVIRDASGNRKLDKSKATRRIDGAVALAMAIGAASRDLGPIVDVYDGNLLLA